MEPEKLQEKERNEKPSPHAAIIWMSVKMQRKKID